METNNIDIEKLKDVNEKLNAISLHRVSTLLLNNVGLWEWDFKTERLTWDNMTYKVYEVKQEDFHGTYLEWRALIHFDDITSVEQALHTIIEGVSNIAYRFRIRHQEEWRWIFAVAHCIRDIKGYPQYLTGLNLLEPKVMHGVAKLKIGEPPYEIDWAPPSKTE